MATKAVGGSRPSSISGWQKRLMDPKKGCPGTINDMVARSAGRLRHEWDAMGVILGAYAASHERRGQARGAHISGSPEWCAVTAKHLENLAARLQDSKLDLLVHEFFPPEMDPFGGPASTGEQQLSRHQRAWETLSAWPSLPEVLTEAASRARRLGANAKAERLSRTRDQRVRAFLRRLDRDLVRALADGTTQYKNKKLGWYEKVIPVLFGDDTV